MVDGEFLAGGLQDGDDAREQARGTSTLGGLASPAERVPGSGDDRVGIAPSRKQLDRWRQDVEVAAADALDESSLERALEGCDVAQVPSSTEHVRAAVSR